MDARMKTLDAPGPAVLVEVTRGATAESSHRGHIVAVEGDGRVVAYLGVPETVTYLRSASKPHQALPLVTSGAADRFGFDEREVAIACGSHSGEPMHTETVARMLRKLGLDEGALKCGAHEPYSEETARLLRERGEKPSQLHNNCSGKHAGMLAVALRLGAPVEEYDDPSGPVQLAVGRVIEQFSDTPLKDMAVGLDGCGVPTFGVTLHANGRLVSKVGAEGVYTAGVLPCEEWPRGLGVALKLEDGDRDERARPVAAVETLRRLGVLRADELDALSRFAGAELCNRRGDRVGEVRAAFELKRVAD